ncbi:MAG: hypothetical protein LBR91_02430 [Puniceicoccales bacterium]|jgi:hypothetical protein|nr:hypothetical protein [Puniceicoccales bacterium]
MKVGKQGNTDSKVNSEVKSDNTNRGTNAVSSGPSKYDGNLREAILRSNMTAYYEGKAKEMQQSANQRLKKSSKEVYERLVKQKKPPREFKEGGKGHRLVETKTNEIN